MAQCLLRMLRQPHTQLQVLELPLRTAVMVSQVFAGMWRRNGYSLQHQIFFYHNARYGYLREKHIF